MCPRPAARMRSSAGRTVCIVPQKLTSMSARNSSSLVASTDFCIPYPAFAKTAWIDPNSPPVASINLWQSAGEVTSIGTTNARPPMPSISPRTSSSLSALRAPSATGIPARAHARAVARPMPDDAPVIAMGSPLRSVGTGRA